MYFASSVVCLLLILFNDDLWFLDLCLKVLPVDPKYCFVVLFDVIVSLYIMFETRHWLFKGQGSLRQLQSLSFVVLLSFILLFFLLLCAIILLLKLLVQLYDILIVLRLSILLYGWFSLKDVVIRFKNCLPILELTFRLNGGLKSITSPFLIFYGAFIVYIVFV